LADVLFEDVLLERRTLALYLYFNISG